jgi:hypothetical protein
MKLKNIWLAFKDQLPWKRLWRNYRNGRIIGLLHIRSHQNADGKPKIKYNTKATAIRSAAAMAEKRSVPFGNWKCLHCDGYHIGKNKPFDEIMHQ